jgi:hypothetical protein
MITPRLTALIVAMSVLGTGGPLAAMAQEQNIGNTAGTQNLAQEITQAASTAIEQNQANVATVTQTQATTLTTGKDGEIEIEEADVGTQESEVEQSNEAEAESGDIEQEAEAEQEAEQEVEGADLENFIAALVGDITL